MSSVVDRFMRYARVSTQSDPDNADRTPSNPDEFDLARLLRDDLVGMGVSDASTDEHAYVIAHLPASEGAEGKPCVGLIAHIDTSPDAPARGVEPRIVRFEGEPLELGRPGGVPVAIDATNTPELDRVEKGADIICTDGSTLLGADDKTGVAEIMELVSRIRSDPSIPHPPLAICFAPDEEIGHGCELLDLDRFGAQVAYTIDGGAIGEVEYETFNAASAEVHFQGRTIHPGSAKGIMVNALHLFEEFDAMLPAWERPEHTENREGFFHLSDVCGTCESATARYIIRDHDRDSFESRKALMLRAADFINERLGENRVSCTVTDQYYNMASCMTDHMELVENACKAFEDCGVEARVQPVRGGTDGAQLSFRGLPCPNLSAGGLNFHSVREFVPVKSLETMVDVLERLVGIFAQD
jgi:tripeptide aminopeptidase